MHIRKLVKSGHSSLVVAVPIGWIKNNKLKAGDLLYIKEDIGNLLISPESKEKTKEKKEIVINVDGKNSVVVDHEITTAYLNNFHMIIIKGKELNKFSKSVKIRITQLVALELIEESSERIVARNFLNMYDIDLKALVRRMDNIIRSMITDTKESVYNNELVNNIVERDLEVNRLSFLVFKILKAANSDDSILKSIKITKLGILRYWELTMNLEKIGDRVKNIVAIVPELDKKYKKSFLKLFYDIEEIYRDIMKAFYILSVETSDLVSIRRKEIILDIHKYIKKNDSTVCSQIAINAFNMITNINEISKIIRFLPD